MSVGAWTPDSQASDVQIEADFLKRAIALAEGGEEQLTSLSAHISEAEVQNMAPIMRAEKDDWVKAASHYSSDELLALIRFFTLAEMQLPGWEAGDKSPVIWLNKIRRQQGEKLDRDTLLWMRENSDNRFIPNGGL